MDVSNLTGRTALVTGAGSGIGRETAVAFARRGANLVLCDVSKEGLEGTEGRIQSLRRGDVWSHVVDVADPAQMADFSAAVHQRVPALDVLMNNAGVAIGGGTLDTSLADWEWILGVNLRGVIHGCHHFVPKMVERGAGGHVINISSAAGYTPAAELAAYCTTKYAVLGLSESLRDELAPHGIGVTAVCPGIIDTPITRAAKMVGKGFSEEIREEMVRTYERRGYTPERVARNILKAVQKNRAVAPIAAEAWALYYAKRLFPGSAREALGPGPGAQPRAARPAARLGLGRRQRLGTHADPLRVAELGAGQQRADHAEVGHHADRAPGVTLGDLGQRGPHALADLATRLPASGTHVRLALLEALERLRVELLDLLPGEPGPAAHVQLAQPRIRRRLESMRTCHGPRRLEGALEVAREQQLQARPRERPCQPVRLLAAGLGQRRIGLALPAALGVPGGLGVADQQEGRGLHGRRSLARSGGGPID